MPLSPTKSAQYTSFTSVPTKMVKATDWHAKRRSAYGKMTLTGAGQGDGQMIRMPAGRIRIFPRLSRLVAPQGAASSTLAVGIGAYTKRSDGSAVAADTDALLTATSTAGGAVTTALLGTAAGQIESVEVDSRDGFDITITAAGGNTASSGDIEVLIEYAQGN